MLCRNEQQQQKDEKLLQLSAYRLLVQTTRRQEVADSKQLPTKESVKKRGHLWLTYLLAALYADSEQSPTVALSTAGDAAHLRGRGQVCALQQEIRMQE